MEIRTFVIRLLMALLCGVLIGFERQLRQRNAGLTTNSLVAVGACIFILISESVIDNAIVRGGMVNNDNLRVLAQIVTGMGFLGAGVILRDGFTIHGLNSAATLWCAAAVGAMCGYGLSVEAIVSVVVILFINWILKPVERFIESHQKNNTPTVQDSKNDNEKK